LNRRMKFLFLLFSLLLEFPFIISFQGFRSSSVSTLRRCLQQRAFQHQSVRRFNLLKRLSSTDSSFLEEDRARWERMYAEGGSSVDSSGATDAMFSRKSEVKVVSFDLDNTLWKTFACINAANDALALFLDENKIKQPKRVEEIMGDLFRDDKTRYSPILCEEATSATLLTLLRTDAVQKVLEDDNGYSKSDAETFAQTAFDVWTTARHDAIPDNLSSNVLECLEEISNLRTSQGHKVLIGAITDGNSDPRRVKILEKYFDFCVNAEQVGVSKPDKRVYLEAVRQVASHPSARDLPSVLDMDGGDFEAGPYWVHVGDDFVKDIVAAKDLKMRTVWATELVRESLEAKLSTDDTSRKASSGDNGDVKDFVKRISEKTVVELSIGADNYLADSFTEEFVDAVTEEFHHLGAVITKWHAEGVSASAQPLDVSDTNLDPKLASGTAEAQPSDGFRVEDAISVIMPDAEPSGSSAKNGVTTHPPARAFRITRGDCSSDIAAPLRDRDTRAMQEVMGIAQLDKSSGVFAFEFEDVEDVRVGEKVLMVKVSGTDLEFSREIFSKMTVQDVLSLSAENPLKLSLYIKDASSAPSFDMF
jgi:FMN phosphatase YigB (HAD superfamily)